MNNLTTINNQFEYNLPVDFVPENLNQKYMLILKAKKKIFKNTVDYLNSTILSITFPSFSYEKTNNQYLKRKEINYKPVNNIYDLFDKTVTITFLNVDSNLNYMIMLDVLTNNYLKTDTVYDKEVMLTMIDENRRGYYKIKYSSVMFNSLSENNFAYNEDLIQNKTFTVGFTYNFLDFEFLIDNKNIISNQ